MDPVAQHQEIVLPPRPQSILIGRTVFFGGFAAVFLFLGIASQFNIPWIERSSPATDLGILGSVLLFATPLISTVWEALDRSPVMVVDGNGVKLHPCFGVPALKWDDIEGADLSEEWGYRGGARSELIISLATKLRSWNHPFGRDSVMINAKLGSEEEELLTSAAAIINATASA